MESRVLGYDFYLGRAGDTPDSVYEHLNADSPLMKRSVRHFPCFPPVTTAFHIDRSWASVKSRLRSPGLDFQADDGRAGSSVGTKEGPPPAVDCSSSCPGYRAVGKVQPSTVPKIQTGPVAKT